MRTTEHVAGVEIPKLGLGTLGNVGDDARRLVEAALAEGYRHIDTSQYYGNEDGVGAGLARSSAPRDDVWLTTKILHPKAPRPPDVRSAAGDCLRRLGVDHVDALLIHWPNPDWPLDGALEVFTALRDEGVTRTIGVSNFPSAMLREALGLVPDLAIEQVEYHPYLDQQAVFDVVREHDMVLTAHSPLVRGRILEDPVVREIAAANGMGPAQVALRWVVQQHRAVAIPGGSPERLDELRQNLAVLDIALTDDEMARLGALSRGERVVDPPHGPDWDA